MVVVSSVYVPPSWKFVKVIDDELVEVNWALPLFQFMLLLDPDQEGW